MTGRATLVTGATGFVGGAFLRVLAEQGAPIRAVIRAGTADRLPDVPGMEVVETPDMFAEPADWWKRQCEEIDRIAHFAWVATPGEYLTSPQNLDCLSGTLALAKGAAEAGVAAFMGTGTCFEYDLDRAVLAVDTPLRPTSPYAGAKVAAYAALSQWLPANGVRFSWARLFYLMGEGEHPDRLIPYLHSTLAAGTPAELSSGRQIRDFIDVTEGARIMLSALDGGVEGAFNVCSGIPVTVRQVAEQIADSYGRRDLLIFGARPDNLVDPACVVGVPLQGGARP